MIIIRNRQKLNDYQNKTSLKKYRDEQQAIANDNLSKANNLKSQIASLDKKQSAQLAELNKQWNNYKGLYQKAQKEVAETNEKINNPNFYNSEISALKSIIKQQEEEIKESENKIKTIEVLSVSSPNTYDDFKKIREEHNKILKQKERSDVIENISGLRVDFDVDKSIFGGTNKITLKIYNLPKEYRLALYQNMYLYTNHTVKQTKTIHFDVGYEGDTIYNIFNGDLIECYSYQQGLDIVTQIEAWDTALTFERKNREISLKENIDRRSFILSVLGGRLPIGKSIVYIDNSLKDDYIIAPINLTKNPTQDIKTYSVDKNGNQMNVFVENGKVYIVSANTAIDYKDVEQSLSSSTNLLETPRFNGGTISCKCLFLPNIKLGQVIALYSEIDEFVSGAYLLEKQYNLDKKNQPIVKMTELPVGNYKIVNIKHIGSVSDTSETKVYSMVELQTSGLYFESLSVKRLELSNG